MEIVWDADSLADADSDLCAKVGGFYVDVVCGMTGWSVLIGCEDGRWVYDGSTWHKIGCGDSSATRDQARTFAEERVRRIFSS